MPLHVLGLIVALQPFKVAILCEHLYWLDLSRVLVPMVAEERAISEVKLSSIRDMNLYWILIMSAGYVIIDLA